jgi:hypothetical protein
MPLAKCVFCGADTIMFVSDTPVCDGCDDRIAERLAIIHEKTRAEAEGQDRPAGDPSA